MSVSLPYVPEPVLDAEEREKLRVALETQESWDAYLAALPCPDDEEDPT